MKQSWLYKQHNQDLLLFFNGWGCDTHILEGLSVPGRDVLVMYDYHDLDWDHSVLTSYRDICLLAWSFGVFAAHHSVPDTDVISRRIAVNGTPWPIDDSYGIPPSIFHTTRDAYNETGRRKFFARVMGGLKQYETGKQYLPERTTENQKEELICLENMAQADRLLNVVNDSSLDFWNMALLAKGDRIFPPENMSRAWKDKAVIIDGPHLPDFNWVVDKYITS